MQLEFKIFDYISELDCFVVNKDYELVAKELGLTEWNSVVWIGRYFCLDNDFGEHWFDNWEERDSIQQRAENLGYNYDDLLVINPDKFKNGQDGPTHSSEQRKLFWTDVLKSLRISKKMLFEESRKLNSKRDEDDPEFIPNLEDRIAGV